MSDRAEKSNVSREHCIVRRLDDDTYEVEDCSKNGVYVEGAYLGKGNKVQAETGNWYGCVMNHRNFDWDSGKRE